jgi:uncharacterized protein YbjT (DUF2867 family)
MNVLVTGGTGFVGQEVVRELHCASHRIHFLSRRRSYVFAYAIEEEFGGLVYYDDILDPRHLESDLKEAKADIDTIIHLVGIISESDGQTYERVHTTGTENLLRIAQKLGVKRFVHMSALGTRAGAMARYHRSKWAAEELVRGSGLEWTIFRPSIIFGPGDGFVNLFAKIIRRSPVVPIMGDGHSKFQPVAVENVATAFVQSLAEPRALRQTFDLCGNETLSLNEIIDTILAVLQRKRLKVHVPLAIARVQAALLEFLFGKLLRRPPPLNRDQLIMLQEDNVGNGQAADELFGLKPVKFREAIAAYLNLQ